MTSKEVLHMLLRIALGNETCFSLPSMVDWTELIAISYREGVAALAVEGLQILYNSIPDLDVELDSPALENMKYEWLGFALQLEDTNKLHNLRAAQLTRLFSDSGYRSCILKGQGNSLLYSNPNQRQCGDIDIWVEGGRKQVLRFLRSNNYNVEKTVVHHANLKLFPDVTVEVHYIPAWLYNIFTNRKLQRFFAIEANAQYNNLTELGFSMPQARFNLVYNAVHIYKHYFQNEYSLKQLVDYYYIIQHSTEKDRRDAMIVLKQVKLDKFVSWLMGQLEQNLGMSPDVAMCKATSGKCHRPCGELLSIIPWKVWHWFARRYF